MVDGLCDDVRLLEEDADGGEAAPLDGDVERRVGGVVDEGGGEAGGGEDGDELGVVLLRCQVERRLSTFRPRAHVHAGQQLQMGGIICKINTRVAKGATRFRRIISWPAVAAR